MTSKYVDVAAILQVIGNVYNNPNLLDDTDKYNVTDEDFPNEFHRIVFGSIYKIHELGSSKITLENINDFLSTRPKYEAIYKQNKGDEWLLKVSQSADRQTFDYYYGRMKKMTLLRAYETYGIDVNELYDPDNILDSKKKQAQEEWLDNSNLEDIANRVDERIEKIKLEYASGVYEGAVQAGDGIESLIDKLKETPEVGVPLYGPYMNTVTRGARLGKFYLRSAATGVGKTRSLIADACYIACGHIFDDTYETWRPNGIGQPTLFITTEQGIDEVQTMMLAFLSNVNEEHIVNGKYVGNEEERVREAAKVIAESPLYIVTMPDFSLQDIENTIKKNLREHDVKYVFLDYIHTSMKIMEEITRRSGGVKIREDNILFMLSIKLKDLCVQNDIFIFSATQLNGQYVESETPDQNLLRGAKAIADKIDWGAILLNVRQEDLDSLETIMAKNAGISTPTIKMSIYKNRRGRYKGIYLWCTGDLGTCRIKPMFATTYNYELVEMNDVQITVDKGAF